MVHRKARDGAEVTQTLSMTTAVQRESASEKRPHPFAEGAKGWATQAGGKADGSKVPPLLRPP